MVCAWGASDPRVRLENARSGSAKRAPDARITTICQVVRARCHQIDRAIYESLTLHHSSSRVVTIHLPRSDANRLRFAVGLPLDQRSVLAENPVTRVVVRAVPGAGAAAGAAERKLTFDSASA